MTEPTSTGRRSNRIFSAIGAVILLYLIGSATLSGALTNTSPAIATAWWPRPPMAGANIADERMRAGDFKAVLKAANWTLEREPLNVSALRDAGLARDKMGQTAQGDALLLFAGKRSWRDLPTELWLLWRNIQTHHFEAAIQDADAVLRVAADQRTDLRVQTLLAAAASYPPTAKPLIAALAASPPWRVSFLNALANSTAPVSACDTLLTGLRATSAPPLAADYVLCVNRMAVEGNYDLAIARWRTLASGVPGAAGTLRDGGFTQTSDESVFNWSLGSGSGAQVAIASYPGTGGGGGLEVDYDGVSQPPLAQQLLVLPPGSFTVKGREDTGASFSDATGAPAGMRWQIVCATGQVLGQSDLLGDRQGERAFAFRFVAPAGCPAEWIRLVPSPGERPHEMTLWFTGLSVEGPDASAPAAATPSTASAAQTPVAGAR